MKNELFIDPTPLTPRELNEVEMANVSGGVPIIVVVTMCSEALAIGVTAGVIALVT